MSPAPAMKLEETVPRRRALLVWSAIVLVAILRVAPAWTEFSATIDEGRHVAAAVELYQTQDYSIFSSSTPLARYFTGVLPYLAGARLPREGDAADRERLAEIRAEVRQDYEHAVGRYVLERSADYWTTLRLARAGNAVFLVLLLACVYRWTAELFGRAAGLFSSALLSQCPTVLGHGALATTDVPAAATSVLALYAMWCWASAPGLRSCLLAGVAFGVAVGTKITVLPFVLASGVAIFLLVRGVGRSRRNPWGEGGLMRAGIRGLLFLLVAFGVVWASYLFLTSPMADRRPELAASIDRRFSEGSWIGQALHWVHTSLSVPMPVLADMLVVGKRESSKPWPCYLLGEITHGRYDYFAVAFLLKATPFFVLSALASVLLVLARRCERLRPAFPVLASAAVFLVGSSLTRMNIGVRHVMPLWPLLAILAGAPFALDAVRRAVRGLRVAALVLLGAHGVDSALVHPDYLAYFTPFARGEPQHYLLDSNLDWGQDIGRLVRHAEEHGIEDVTLSVFGARYGTSPASLGLEGARLLLDPTERPRGWFAVSFNHLVGIGMPVPDYEALDRFRWLEGHRPTARIGQSILLYRLP